MTTPAPAGGDAALRIGTEMTIAAAAGLRETLVDAVAALPADATALRLDLSAVHDFDSSGVQLLLSTQRSLAERGAALTVVAAAAAVHDALQLFGLAALMHTPAATAA